MGNFRFIKLNFFSIIYVESKNIKLKDIYDKILYFKNDFLITSHENVYRLSKTFAD